MKFINCEKHGTTQVHWVTQYDKDLKETIVGYCEKCLAEKYPKKIEVICKYLSEDNR